MRVLALDHGTARIGCAISDPTGTLARPLPTIEPPEPRTVADLVAEHEVERVVVGLPLTLRGEQGEQALATESFVEALRGVVSVPVEMYDERFTTTLASQAGGSADEDARAAAHLLESYLGSRAQ